MQTLNMFEIEEISSDGDPFSKSAHDISVFCKANNRRYTIRAMAVCESGSMINVAIMKSDQLHSFMADINAVTTGEPLNFEKTAEFFWNILAPVVVDNILLAQQAMRDNNAKTIH